MADLSVIILTYNEQKHIERCIRSIQSVAKEVFIVDSYSTDRTREICESLGARFVQNKFQHHAQQFNWALDNLPISTQWVMRMDSDEFLLPELADEVNQSLGSLPDSVTGVNLKRRVYFMGRWIKHGGYYPIIILRIFRRGAARSEMRMMDEHIRVTHGQVVQCKHDFVDENLNDLTWWTDKHNRYATREAIDLLDLRYHLISEKPHTFSATTKQAERKRWLKEKLYAKLPPGLRPLLYFIYRYVLRAGFLDGVPGLVWHTLQGFWYRFLVDAKVIEIERKMRQSKRTLQEILEADYGFRV